MGGNENHSNLLEETVTLPSDGLEVTLREPLGEVYMAALERSGPKDRLRKLLMICVDTPELTEESLRQRGQRDWSVLMAAYSKVTGSDVARPTETSGEVPQSH